jgi:ribosome-associated protein
MMLARFGKTAIKPSKFAVISQTSFANCRLFSSTTDVIDTDITASSVTSDEKSAGGPTWGWVPPQQIGEVQSDRFTSNVNDSDVIPVKPLTLLSSSEIVTALEKMGGIDVKSVPLTRKFDNIKEMIIVTGSSTRHIKKMADAIVQALKSRNLKKAMGYKGAEGEPNDDWLLVDCYDKLVHLMLDDTRSSLNLEQHWGVNDDGSINTPPTINFNKKESIYEKDFENLLEKYPIPDTWNNDSSSSLGTIGGTTSSKTKGGKRPKIEYL